MSATILEVNPPAVRTARTAEARSYLTDRLHASQEPLVQGLGLHPGAVTGYVFTQPENVLRVRKQISNGSETNRLPVIFGVDVGSCDDLEALSYACGFVSSNASPNAWCAVQAKCEGIPSVIGLLGSFQDPNSPVSERRIDIDLEDGNVVSLNIPARKIVIKNSAGQWIHLWEGDVVTIDGDSGKVFAGKVVVTVPVVKEVHRLMVGVMKESIDRFGPVQGWRRYRDTEAYQRSKPRLVALVGDKEFANFADDMQRARHGAPLKVMATAHTVEGTLQARIAFADIAIDADGEIVVLPNDADTGIGLLRTERLFRSADELDALRVLILGEEIAGKAEYMQARTAVLRHETSWLSDILAANSGCPTVVRTLCMPFNKLFPDDLDTSALSTKYGIDADRANARIRDTLKESETFHGCRGARLHMLRNDLAKLEIESILLAAANTLSQSGGVDLTILVSMVTFPEEISSYMRIYDEVYDSLLEQKLKLPKARLATMVETSASYHLIEKFPGLRTRHIHFAGALFGGNDFTAATLNLNRHDAVRTVIPHYIKLGILQTNPFLSLQQDIVGAVICSGLTRIRQAAGRQSLTIGFGGEQAGDWTTVSWLSRNAAPLGLNYVSTSPDRMVEALFSAASVCDAMPMEAVS